MRNKNILCVFFNYWIFLQNRLCFSDANNNTICDVDNIEQCVLCAYCESYDSYETKKVCNQPAVTKYFEDKPDLRIDEECYGYGDHADFIHSGSKSSFSSISILPPAATDDGEIRMCYFNISYYNTLEPDPKYNDTACVEYGSTEHNIQSKHQTWKVKHKKIVAWGRTTKAFKYQVTAAKGKISGKLDIQNLIQCVEL